MSNLNFSIVAVITTATLLIAFSMFAYSYQPKRYCTAYEEAITGSSLIKGTYYKGHKYMKCVAYTKQKPDKE